MNQGATPGTPSGGEGENPRHARGQALLASASLALTGLVFAVDLWQPSGITASIAYVAPVLVGWWSAVRRLVILSGILATSFSAAAFLLSPPSGPVAATLANRALALFAVWAIAMTLARVRLAADRLEFGYAARTAELQEARAALARTERLAAMGQLTGTVAHELRNPLGVIATSIAVIETMSREAKLDIDAALARASRSIRRCESIITEHLDFARARGHQPVSLILDYWLSGALDEIAIAGDITLNRDLQTGGAVVRFDPETLRRAVINLVDNACQAMAEGSTGKEVIVASRTDGKDVEITVTDSGPGIPADIRAQIMEPLFSTKVSGTGLGLATVQRIMDEHGGSLRIDSTPGIGTRVTMRLPHAVQG